MANNSQKKVRIHKNSLVIQEIDTLLAYLLNFQDRFATDLAGNHTYDLAVQMTATENEGEKPALLQLFKNVKNAMVGVVQDLTPINF